jgi:erythrin-vacuolar iron transport family protein
MAKHFRDLSEQEVLALAIALEDEDSCIYREFAEGLSEDYPSTAKLLREMQHEEEQHRASLAALYHSRFGERVPLIRRQDVRGFVSRPPVWLIEPIGPKMVRRAVLAMETETREFYHAALNKVTDPATRKLLSDLAEAELKHTATAEDVEKQYITPDTQKVEATVRKRAFVLKFVQPGLAGLMDGSVSTLAPLFAAAFATHQSWDAFRVGLAASIGAGISMAFAEALSDDGSLTGRGRPIVRGIVTGVMTTIGGIGHTLPYLIENFHLATTVAVVVVVLELAAISWIRNHFMETPLLRAAMQVVLGGALVFAAGIWIGSA